MMKKRNDRSAASEEVVRIDLRVEMTQAREPWEPLSKILWAASQLGSGQVLELVAPFEPLLLIRVLTAQGLGCETKRSDAGDWEVRFRREGTCPANGQGDENGRAITLDLLGVKEIPSLATLIEALLQLPETAAELIVHSDHPLDTGKLPDHCSCASVRSAKLRDGGFCTRIHIRNE